ncbi:drug/metabolite transporter superfamily permease [Vibrio vulnificus]|uniref:DMT family transporter n=1 Tax=Vibrio vulnificus TaxID=672 RepID=UPI0001F5B171|nr:DMT family transporter [Vibrio vulnificus]ADV89375.1 permease of the drug/metabolite transporter (DMT) superfamily [Vibrio vulnificus MO6-24/O]EGR0040429.1 DMT family transporter [Vibrio vulnificus]EGR0092116.1 DMT family transporter [Vibrio vulnificus]EGR0097692.1 DMT family transporter [Vibrio vulnificus]EGR7941697.1 DMT family transporter [Vibrio vulnificus]
MSAFPLTAIAMIAFAANSVFCRLALAEQSIDPGSFTFIRLLSGAVTLLVILSFTQAGQMRQLLSKSTFLSRTSVLAGVALFGYAVAFSYAYVGLTTGTGALILFAVVQFSLIAFHLLSGHRPSKLEWGGVALSISGFILLMSPSAQTPNAIDAFMMAIAGVCWAIFTLLGKQAQSPTQAIAQGFSFASLLALLCGFWLLNVSSVSVNGIVWALLSGVLASGIGYVVWYMAVKSLSVLQASIAQLSVPVIAMAAGVIWLNEPLTIVSTVASALVLGGIALIFTSNAQK